MSNGIAVVTGASAGVGRATAKEFAQRGFDVALLARGSAGLSAAAEDVERLGGRALPLTVDISEYQQIDEAAGEIEVRLGDIDIWVNNAMTTVFSPIWDTAPEDFERAVRVTFLGQVWGTKAALARMRPRDRGIIVNVGSALAFLGIPLQSAYCSSKFACRGFVQSVRSELLHEGSHVRISMVQLPAVNTPQFDWCRTTLDYQPQPVPPIYEPELPARWIVQTAIDGRTGKVVGSWNKLLIAAGQVAPGLGNHYAARGAWEGQLTDQRIDPDRPDNLRRPVDEHQDRGARGQFDRRSGGFTDPSFLRTLPQAVGRFVVAAIDDIKDKRPWASRSSAR
jgi:NAD(P)-dependent dehydrogenase (short-subunit alcohol dehydrogenase family)